MHSAFLSVPSCTYVERDILDTYRRGRRSVTASAQDVKKISSPYAANHVGASNLASNRSKALLDSFLCANFPRWRVIVLRTQNVQLIDTEALRPGFTA